MHVLSRRQFVKRTLSAAALLPLGNVTGGSGSPTSPAAG
ncbi:MAG: twin-arginine translocation signal domain-containing protein [Sedimentisphaerales bacterium]|nr:twin-arginine translocation signal domain-containing protein [Sedimentisphaerales bacterium]